MASITGRKWRRGPKPLTEIAKRKGDALPDHPTWARLWASATDYEGLFRGWEKVRSNAGSAGGDGISVRDFDIAATLNIRNLQTSLKDGSYSPSPCRRVLIPKRKGGHRRLMIPSIRDRVIQTTLAETLKPILEPLFEESSFAYRPGRSVQQAVQKIEHWRNEGYHHVIEADIVSYFDHVQHTLLIGKLTEAIGDGDVDHPLRDLIANLLCHGGQQLGSPGVGLVQGSPLSPALANLYLDALDEALHKRGIRIVRFADDFVILCKKRSGAEKALVDATSILREHGLELHDQGTRIVDFDRGFNFIGHLFVRSLAVKKTYDDDLTDLSFERPLNKAPSSPSSAEPKVAALALVASLFDQGLRVMYITNNSRSLGTRNQSFVVRADEVELAAVSHRRLDRIEVTQGANVHPSALDLCLATDTHLVFVNGWGESLGDLARSRQSKSRLQYFQAQAALDNDLSICFARKLIDARIRNQRTQLQRLNRERKIEAVGNGLNAMGRLLRKLSAARSVDALRGLEGATAAIYWPLLGKMTGGVPASFHRKRPATDPFNAVINYLTAVLERDIKWAMNSVGLHLGFGILHSPNDYADAAIYDLMEPFRAPLTEGLASYLFNARRVRAEMFEVRPTTTTRMNGDAIKAIISGYEQAVAKRVNITGRKGKLAWRPMMRRQALDLASAFRHADPERFKPYLMEP